MNAIDRVVAYFAPQTGLRRAAARVGLDNVRIYDGAKGGRRADGWRATNASANVEVKAALPRLRARSRDLVRNTWWGARIQRVTVAHAVGTGIVPKPNTGDKTLDRKVLQAWKKWARHCDHEGQLNFDGLLGLAADCIVESGEVLGRMVSVKPADKPRGVVPLELQLLEPDHLDQSRDRIMMVQRPPQVAMNAEGVVVDQGIEYALDGKRRAYWIYPVHPGARGLVMPSASVRVPAADMLHAYRKDRIGQGRGVPWLAPVMLTGRDFADLQEAIVVKARIEACLAAFIKTNSTARTLAQAQQQDDGDGHPRRIENFSPGMVAYLEPGEELQTVAPSGSLQFDGVLRNTLLAIAAGAGITYDQLTGDFTRANFSSLKAGKIDFRRIVEQFQHHTIVAMILEPLWDRWCELAIAAGILPDRAEGYPVDWIMPANEPIDAMKEMQADILAVRSGRMTWAQFVLSWGIDPDQQLDEIEKWFTEIDARGIVLDTDPRKALASTKGGAGSEAQTEVNTNVDKGNAGAAGKSGGKGAAAGK
ncbi:phage portal protein [Rhodopseudomonas sp. BR0G17]|uniref:phage portal protein n=1 Tax=Rhodopseudomonas sp. BR0G17 TaxID=2269368 RepID=UPI0013DE8848|nr:phage portal protein [Rhodopseudomonas sp. BR0G17]NEW96636.1 phage portal protein [Rhodopseudomonas sp. BR0G17]